MTAREKLAVQLKRVDRTVGPVGKHAQRTAEKLELEEGGFGQGFHLTRFGSPRTLPGLGCQTLREKILNALWCGRRGRLEGCEKVVRQPKCHQ